MRRILGGLLTTIAMLVASFTIPGFVPAASAASIGTVTVSAPSFKFPSYGTGCYYGNDYKVTVPVSGLGAESGDIDVELRVTAPDRSTACTTRVTRTRTPTPRARSGSETASGRGDLGVPMSPGDLRTPRIPCSGDASGVERSHAG